jgi:hypothetical protein
MIAPSATEVPAPPQATARACEVCGAPSDAAECTACVIAADVAFTRALDQ